MKKCGWCGEWKELSKFPQKGCCKACKSERKLRQSRERGIKPANRGNKETGVCVHGHPSYKEGINGHWFCLECRRLKQYKIRRNRGDFELGGISKCERCGTSFVVKAKNHTLCSENCGKIEEQYRQCTICENFFVANTSNQTICSDDGCQRKYNSMKQKEWYDKNAYKKASMVRSRKYSIELADQETLEHIKWCTNQLCSYCWELADTHDHIIPSSKGGSNHWSNIVPACRSCNSSKQDLDLLQWLWTASQPVVGTCLINRQDPRKGSSVRL